MDPAQCPPGESSCTKYFRSATEKEGSDGSEFIVDPGDRLVVEITSPGMASDPDIFEDPNGFVMLVSRGQDVQAFNSSELRGSYGSTGLMNDFLSFGSGGVPAGYYDSAKSSYWIFVHQFDDNTEVIKRAVHPSLSIDILGNSFKILISGEDFPELGETYSVASPGFTLNEE